MLPWCVTMVIYGPWENTAAYPMFTHRSVSLGWLWNCNVVNQKASFICTLYIYIYLYIVTVWYLAKCMTRRHFFSAEYIYFHSTCKYILSIVYALKKPRPPPPLHDQPEKQWPLLSISNFFITPQPFCSPPMERNNDRSLLLLLFHLFFSWHGITHPPPLFN